MIQGIKHGFQGMGVKSLEDLNNKVSSGHLRFEIRSPSSQREGGVHSLSA